MKIDSDIKIRSLPPNVRHCRFEDENDILKLYQQYSQSNCFLECLLNVTHNQLRKEKPQDPTCTPWMLPFMDKESTYCDPWQAQRFMEIILEVVKPNTCQQCLPDCSQTIYTPMITTVPFRYQE